MISDLVHLFYPKLCFGCNKALLKGESNLCLYCLAHLPKTNWHLDNANPLKTNIGSRIAVKNATAYLYFNKGERVQSMLHKLKYQGKQQIGVFLGNMAGYELIEAEGFQQIDAIVPVPLHKNKLKQRGYNQSELFAQGLSLSMNKPVLNDIIERVVSSETQTRKARYNRWENVENIFVLASSAKQFTNKHLLLVDDVATTGATLEACAIALQKIPGVSLSIATIAYA